MLISLTDRISRLPASEAPLSADVFFIEGDEYTYVYDVGGSDAAFAALSALKKPVAVILSHFHRDHTANLGRFTPDVLYVGARTRKQLGQGTIVDSPLTITDGVTLEIHPCVSPHAPGCLILTVDGTHTLIGDLTYARPGQGQGEAKGAYNALRALDTQFFVPSHMDGNPLVPKGDFLREIKTYFQI